MLSNKSWFQHKPRGCSGGVAARAGFHSLTDGILARPGAHRNRLQYPLRLCSGSRTGTGVSTSHHESPVTPASGWFPCSKAYPHPSGLPPATHPKGADQPQAPGKTRPVTAPTRTGRKFKVLSLARKTLHVLATRFPKMLLFGEDNHLIYSQEANWDTPGFSLVVAKPSHIQQPLWGLPNLSKPPPLQWRGEDPQECASRGRNSAPLELDCEESWSPKNRCFWTVVLEKTLESPLDCKEIQPVHPEGDKSWVFIGGTDVEAETPILWPPDAKSWLIWKDPDVGKDWGQEGKGTTEAEIVGWHHWLNGHEFG